MFERGFRCQQVVRTASLYHRCWTTENGRGNKPATSATSSSGMDLHSGKVVMNDDKLVLYESLIRASLVLIFGVALIVGALGLVVISQTFMRQAVTNSQFLSQRITSE